MSDPYGQTPQPPPYHQPPQPYVPRPLSPSDERMWGMFGHLSAIAASFLGLPFLGPLIVFLVLKDRSRFVREHAGEALNMTISLIIYEVALFIVCTVVSVVTLGLGSGVFLLTAVPGILALVFTIMAAVAANQGRAYRYPLILRLVR